jgi:hypothetical protein
MDLLTKRHAAFTAREQARDRIADIRNEIDDLYEELAAAEKIERKSDAKLQHIDAKLREKAK